MSTLVLARKGDIVTAEVTGKNEGKRLLYVSLETDQTSCVPESQLAGEDRLERSARFNRLAVGDTFTVVVTEVFEDAGNWKNHGYRLFVSERALDEADNGRDEVQTEEPKHRVLSADVVAKAQTLVGKVLNGTILGTVHGGGRRIRVDGIVGVLPRGLFCTKSGDLATEGHTRVRLLMASEDGITFTRENIA